MEDKFLKVLGARIKRIRISKKISQITLSFNANISVGFLRKIEKGKISPSVITLIKIAAALHMEISELVEFED